MSRWSVVEHRIPLYQIISSAERNWKHQWFKQKPNLINWCWEKKEPDNHPAHQKGWRCE
jgi:hypothetical protein